MGSALLDPVPNPFFGNPAFGAFASERTIPRGQLLRPYPQFGDLLAHQVSEGRARYHSLVLRLERPIVGGWGGRINYTWSNNKNNIFGERNQFSNDSNNLARPVNSYDVEAEFSNSITEQPHRLNFALTAELPFGKGKSRLSEPGLARVLFGGWAVTALGYFQSGFPVAVIQAANNSGVFGRVQRPNLTGTSPATSGSTESHYDPVVQLHQQLVQRRRLVDGPRVHLRQRSADGHGHAHAVQDPDRRGLPEDRAGGRGRAHDPRRDHQHLQQHPVQRAEHDVRLLELRPDLVIARLPAPPAADVAVQFLGHGFGHRGRPFRAALFSLGSNP